MRRVAVADSVKGSQPRAINTINDTTATTNSSKVATTTETELLFVKILRNFN